MAVLTVTVTVTDSTGGTGTAVCSADIMPTVDNTGVPAGTVLTAMAGDQIITTPGTVISERWVSGRILVRAANVTIQRSRIAPTTAPASNTAPIDCTHTAAVNCLIVDCDVVPATPSLYFTGVLGHDYTLRRAHIWHVVDGAGVYNAANPNGPSGVVIEDTLIERHGWWKPDPNQSDGSHTDGIQLQGGTGTIIRRVCIRGEHDTAVGNSPWTRNASDVGHQPAPRSTSGIQIGPNVGAINGLLIERNWILGGEVGIQATHAGNAGVALGIIRDNRFDDHFYAGHAIDLKATATATTSGNVVNSTGAPAQIRSI